MPQLNDPPRVPTYRNQPSLCDLPLEITDLIIEFILGFPGRANSDAYTTRELFSHPIVNTSKQLRRVALNVLTTRCTWVRFTGPNNMLMDYEMGPYVRDLISHGNSSTYDVIFHKLESPGSEPQDKYTVMFPFSLQECFRFTSNLGAMLRTQDVARIHLEVTRNVDSASLRQMMDDYILYPLQQYFVPRLAGLTVEDEERSFPPPSDRHPIWDLTNAVDLIDRLRRCVEHAQSLQECAQPAYSAYLVLHTVDLIQRATASLAVIYSLSSRMVTRAHILIPLQNDLASLIFDVRVRAGKGLYLLYKSRGRDFLQKHDYLVRNALLLLMEVEILRHPPVTEREQASVHCASALTSLIKVQTLSNYLVSAREENDRDRCATKLARTIQARVEAMELARLAAGVWPDMPELELVNDLCREQGIDTVPLVEFGSDRNEAHEMTGVEQA